MQSSVDQTPEHSPSCRSQVSGPVSTSSSPVARGKGASALGALQAQAPEQHASTSAPGPAGQQTHAASPATSKHEPHKSRPAGVANGADEACSPPPAGREPRTDRAMGASLVDPAKPSGGHHSSPASQQGRPGHQANPPQSLLDAVLAGQSPLSLSRGAANSAPEARLPGADAGYLDAALGPSAQRAQHVHERLPQPSQSQQPPHAASSTPGATAAEPPAQPMQRWVASHEPGCNHVHLYLCANAAAGAHLPGQRASVIECWSSRATVCMLHPETRVQAHSQHIYWPHAARNYRPCLSLPPCRAPDRAAASATGLAASATMALPAVAQPQGPSNSPVRLAVQIAASTPSVSRAAPNSPPKPLIGASPMSATPSQDATPWPNGSLSQALAGGVLPGRQVRITG